VRRTALRKAGLRGDGALFGLRPCHVESIADVFPRTWIRSAQASGVNRHERSNLELDVPASGGESWMSTDRSDRCVERAEREAMSLVKMWLAFRRLVGGS